MTWFDGNRGKRSTFLVSFLVTLVRGPFQKSYSEFIQEDELAMGVLKHGVDGNDGKTRGFCPLLGLFPSNDLGFWGRSYDSGRPFPSLGLDSSRSRLLYTCPVIANPGK